ncbi:unknown [Corallococcus sp. CAG:1435]|nr:unknown [Corallococcus sp. CAG:1435]
MKFDGDAPSSKKKPLVVRDVFFDGDDSQRKKKALLFVGVLLTEMPPSSRKKHSSLLGVLFSGADNQIRTGDLVLTKDVLYLLSHISKILRATCGKVRIAPRLSLSMIPILPAKVNRLR